MEEVKENIIFVLTVIVLLAIIGSCINKFGYRYAGIKELQQLEQRVEILEQCLNK